MIDTVTIISIGVVGQVILIMVKFLTEKFSLSKGLLLLLLATLCLDLVHDLMVHSALMVKWPFLYGTGTIFIFLVGPLMLLYTSSLIYPGFRMRLIYLVLFGPAFFEIIKKIPVFIISTTQKKAELESFYARRQQTSFAHYFDFTMGDFIHLLTDYIQVIVYLIIALILISRRSGKLFITNALKTWLNTFIIVVLIYYIALTLSRVFPVMPIPLVTEVLLLFHSLSLFLVCFLLFRYESDKVGVKPISNSDKSKDELQQLFNTLNEFITREEVFLIIDYKIEDLAKGVKTTKREVSKSINIIGRDNFSDYINRFRIERAKALLKNPEFQHLTIEAIGQMSGFRSKGVFYKAFQKFEAKSPGSFKKEILN